MESTAWSAGCREALAAVAASAAALAAFAGADHADPSGADQAEPSGADHAEPSSADPADPSRAEHTDPLRVLADGCLDGMALAARLDASTAALKVTLAAGYLQATEALAPPALSPHDATCQEMAVRAEVACVLTVSEQTAAAFLSDCQDLTQGLPLTLAALSAGTISWAHARILVAETTGLDPAGAAALEAHFLDPAAPDPARGCPAGDLVPGRFRAKARAWRERHHPVSIETRHTKSAADRRVEYRPDRDGMAWLSAYLPADTAAGIWDRTTAAARALQGPTEDRTLTQLRADTAATWLLTTGSGEGVGGGVPSPRAQVLITVPVLSLLGAGEEPATLDGYGPIPPSMARRLTAGGAGSFYRVLTDPRDGAPLEIGRTSYRLTTAQRHWLQLRDGRCPFPGCNNHSLDNDADHLLAWAHGGTTGITNLGQPCPKHHRLKHSSTWTPAGASKNAPPGWTSPTGRHYPSEQQDWEPPHWPPGLLETYPDPNPDAHMDAAPDRGLPPDPDIDPDRGLPPNPGPYPEQKQEQELPPDPFPDWHLLTPGHAVPAAKAADPGWQEPLEASILEHFLMQDA
ncbi:hypothetical protein J2X01_003715 [Arthrobacter ginsengisoli]|uniref:DUF222 domain-containing protein n=1 Tax=Arthrobacter ginsengisoli TaxID=1356565 RepID=A0ABU1UGT3_9MICC|nr:DUF222 domain-containing protein [Arthrobacter ginsengisoli]MDR7084406.1 hypothetical protein [Arthrobacter ginsengisoli]